MTTKTLTHIDIKLTRKHKATLAFEADENNLNAKLKAIQNVPITNFIPTKRWFENHEAKLREVLGDDSVEFVSVVETTGKYSMAIVYGKLLYNPQYEGKTISIEGEKWKMESNGKMIKQK